MYYLAANAGASYRDWSRFYPPDERTVSWRTSRNWAKEKTQLVHRQCMIVRASANYPFLVKIVMLNSHHPLSLYTLAFGNVLRIFSESILKTPQRTLVPVRYVLGSMRGKLNSQAFEGFHLIYIVSLKGCVHRKKGEAIATKKLVVWLMN